MNAKQEIGDRISLRLKAEIAAFEQRASCVNVDDETVQTNTRSQQWIEKLRAFQENLTPPRKACFEKRDTIEEIGSKHASVLECYILTDPIDHIQLAYAPCSDSFLLVYESKRGVLSSFDSGENALDVWIEEIAV